MSYTIPITNASGGRHYVTTTMTQDDSPGGRDLALAQLREALAGPSRRFNLTRAIERSGR